MAKLIWFLATFVSFMLILLLHNYRGMPVDNQRFEVREQARAAQERMEMERAKRAQELAEQKARKAKEPVLVLDTPELKNGHEVYFKRGKVHHLPRQKGRGQGLSAGPQAGGATRLVPLQHPGEVQAAGAGQQEDGPVPEKSLRPGF